MRALLLMSMVAALVLACGDTAMTPRAQVPAVQQQAQNGFATLLQRYVDLDGQVDYTAWHAAPNDVAALDRYVRELLAHPPTRHPERYRAASDRLAYWLNLYNALVLRNTLERWPVDVVDARALLHELRFEVGDQQLSLLDIETKIIRATFADPRAHFAISCGAKSCALLPRSPFDGLGLDGRLDGATRSFVNRASNVKIDHTRRSILLNPILGWYEADFVRFVKEHTSHPAPTVVDFVRMYAAKPLDGELKRAEQARYRVELMPYDWRVNDVAALPMVDPPRVAEVELAPVPLPDIELELLDGSKLRTADLRGKVVVLDFWATWCRPCLWSFPRYADLMLAHERRGLKIVAVAQDETRAPVDDFVRTNALDIDTALDPSRASAEALHVAALPTVLVVDRAGMIRHRSQGYDASRHVALENVIVELLDERPPE